MLSDDSLVFDSADWSSPQSITLTAVDDSVDDDDESFTLGFGGLPDRVSAGTINEVTVSITGNDDPSISVSFVQTSYTIDEGESFSITVNLSADPERTVVIPISVDSSGDAADGSDYGVPGQVTFNNGETEQTINFTATDEAVDDDNGRVVLSFDSSAVPNVSDGNTTTINITDDDGRGVTVTPMDLEVAEGGSANRPPSIDGPKSLQYPEHSTEPVATYTATDPEGAQITWQIEDTDAEHFRISEDGILAFINPPDYENPVDFRLNNTYEIRLLAFDSGIPRASGRLQVRIEIKDVDLPGVPEGYDANNDEMIALGEAIVALSAFSEGVITREEATAIIKLYFSNHTRRNESDTP